MLSSRLCKVKALTISDRQIGGVSNPQVDWLHSVISVLNRNNTTAFFLLFVCVMLFYWKILLTHQFTLLSGTEFVDLSYASSIHWIRTIRQGGFPLWDPFEMAGRSFAGDMQAAPFNPLHLILALVPFNEHGFLAPGLYNWWYALSRLAGAVFMYALARELRLSPFSSMVAGLSFSLGGFVGGIAWPQYFESAIWMPLIFLFFLRALGAENGKTAILNAHWSGLLMGLGLLAGGLHVSSCRVSRLPPPQFTARRKTSGAGQGRPSPSEPPR
jgi:hypothetical protein